MNWDNVKVFAAIARQGSLSEAAKELGVNHSTILRRVTTLEQDLQVQLFRRLARGYEITAAGERLLDLALMMEKDAIALQRQAIAGDLLPSGSLKVAIPPSNFLDLAPILLDFKVEHPHIVLEIDAGEVLRNLDRLEADVAVRLTNTPPEHYVGRKVLDIPFGLYGHRDYLAAREPVQTVTDIDWIAYTETNLGADMTEWLLATDPNVNINLKVNTIDLLCKAAEQQLGVSFLPQHIADRCTDLRPLSGFADDHFVGFWVMTHTDLRHQPRVRHFMKFVREKLQAAYPNMVAASD